MLFFLWQHGGRWGGIIRAIRKREERALSLLPPHRIYSEDSCPQANRSFSSGWEVIFKKSKASRVLVQRLLLEEEEARSWGTGSGGRVGGDVVLGGNGKNK